MKPYRVTVEVTTMYTVEVHAEDEQAAAERVWHLDSDEIEAQGSAESTKTTYVDIENVEEIQRETEEEDEDVNYHIAPEGQREFGGSAG